VAGACKCGNELRVPHKGGNFLISPGPVSFSRRTLLHGANVTDSSGLGKRPTGDEQGKRHSVNFLKTWEAAFFSRRLSHGPGT
jgi:hypothetical protein